MSDIQKRLIDAVYNFKGKRIAIIGDVALDKYILGRIERVNPENPAAPLLKIEREEYRLGCAANVALNITSLGSDALLGGLIGEDYHGVIFENLCKENRLETFLLKNDKTIVKNRYIESEYDKYLLRTDDGEYKLKPIDDNSARRIYEFFKDNKMDAIILSDYNKRIFRNELGREFVELANSRNIQIIVDPKPANFNSFKGATLLRPNIKEAREIVGEENENEKDIVKRLFDMIESRYVVVTCGKRGMICYDGYQLTEIPTITRKNVDVTGAGDTVCAVVTLGLICGLNLVESAYLANYAAGIVVEKQGTASVLKEELIQRIEQD